MGEIASKCGCKLRFDSSRYDEIRSRYITPPGSYGKPGEPRSRGYFESPLAKRIWVDQIMREMEEENVIDEDKEIVKRRS